MEEFYYTYILQSEKDGKHYAGYTKDLNLRFEQHSKGLVEATRDRRPLKLIYYEACLSQADALKREKYSPCGIKSEILMRSIIPQGKKHTTVSCFLKTGSNRISQVKLRALSVMAGRSLPREIKSEILMRSIISRGEFNILASPKALVAKHAHNPTEHSIMITLLKKNLSTWLRQQRALEKESVDL